MIVVKVFPIFVVCLLIADVNSLSFPGPRVYVVTPSPRPFKVNRDHSAPFYYHNWMRRMDSETNKTTTTTTTVAPKVKTPDLIFAEFENDNSMQKSLRKLLEKEKIVSKSTTTSQPILVPDEETSQVTRVVNYGLPVSTPSKDLQLPVFQYKNKETDYSPVPMYNNDFNDSPIPVYVKMTTQPSKTTTSTTTTSAPLNVENIWHIIDSENVNQYSGSWNEVPVVPHSDVGNSKDYDPTNDSTVEDLKETNKKSEDTQEKKYDDTMKLDENFALPGFGTNTGSGAENESRAIRTEPNIRFPYVDLKPFQMKNFKKPAIDVLSNSKKGNNLYTSLDNFFDLKNPVRGEAQDVVPMNQPIDRYNPAQPYLPQEYGNKVSKQSSPVYSPPKATANLVPPPPPLPPPRTSGNVLPAPSTYESFPPYAPSGPKFAPDSVLSAPPQPAPALPSLSDMPPQVSAPSVDIPIDSYSSPDSDDDMTMPMDIEYNYKPPSPSKFLPTLPPLEKPQMGYSYNKPSIPMPDDSDFQGYQYSKPHKPTADQPPPPATYDSPPSYNHEPYGAPPGDHDFPSDFPGDFKLYQDFDDHHHDHHHDHPTTTTTEMPRVNRFSYYYLGKKLYYLPLYFSVYFIVYVGALIIKAVLRHKIVYPNSWRPNDTTATFFSKRSVDQYLANDNLHEVTGKVTHAIATAAEKYMKSKSK